MGIVPAYGRERQAPASERSCERAERQKPRMSSSKRRRVIDDDDDTPPPVAPAPCKGSGGRLNSDAAARATEGGPKEKALPVRRTRSTAPLEPEDEGPAAPLEARISRATHIEIYSIFRRQPAAPSCSERRGASPLACAYCFLAGCPFSLPHPTQCDLHCTHFALNVCIVRPAGAVIT